MLLLLGLTAAAMAGCGESLTEPLPARGGAVEATLVTSGEDPDPDGYTVRVDGGPARQVEGNGTVRIELAAGEHRVTLEGVAENCEVSGGNSRVVTVTEGGTARVSFEVVCRKKQGELEARTQTSGEDLDPDGYTVTVDGSTSQAIGINGTVTFADVAAGDHQVDLTDVASNCTVDGLNPQTVAVVTQGTTVSVSFQVECAARAGSVSVSAATTGEDPDPDGYTVSVDGGSKLFLAPNGAALFVGLAAGNHQVELGSVATNCTVSGQNPRTVAVTHGATVSTAFDVSCVKTQGDLQVTASTTGDQLDPDGYTMTVDGTSSQSVGTNGTVTFMALPAGDHQVKLTGLAANCWVDGANPQTVTVISETAVSTTFDVKCFAPLSNQIVFESNRDGNWEIYVMNTDGTGQTRLTNASATDRDPYVSPDGTKIVYSHGGVQVMNADGSNPVRLTGGFNAKWSPDGTKIAFTRGNANRNVYVMNADGTGVTQLTTFGGSTVLPTWSPDGTKIAFASDVGGDRDVWVMNADGSNPINLTNNPGWRDSNPEWSPDGSKIYFSSKRDGDEEIYALEVANPSNQWNVTQSPGFGEGYAAFKPDGTKVAFFSDRDGNAEVYVMDPDGSNQTNLTNASAEERAPAWSP